VIRLESCECNPRPLTAAVLAAVLDVPEQILFGDLYETGSVVATADPVNNHDLSVKEDLDEA
jgi:hypothetical protein